MKVGGPKFEEEIAHSAHSPQHTQRHRPYASSAYSPLHLVCVHGHKHAKVTTGNDEEVGQEKKNRASKAWTQV